MGDNFGFFSRLLDVPGSNTCKTQGWSGGSADKNSLDGGGGPGFSVPSLLSELVTPSWLPPRAACEVQQRTAGAYAAAEHFVSLQLVAGRNKVLDVLPTLLSPAAARYVAFHMGVSVGVLESLADIVTGMIEGIRAIPKLARMMLLAADYELKSARTRRQLGVAAGIEGFLMAMPGLRIYALNATPQEERQAHEQVRAIKGEVEAIVGEGWDLTQEGARDVQELWVFLWNNPQGAVKDGKKLGREGLAQARNILAEVTKTVNEPDLHKQYANGERYGKVVGETVLNIAMVISMVGDIAEVARAVGAGAKIGADLAKEAAELAKLERATQGAGRIAAAIRGLRTALEEWRAARAAARMTAELQAKLLADAKKVEKLGAEMGKTVEKQAGGLSKEAEELERTGKWRRGAGSTAEEEPGLKRQQRDVPKPVPSDPMELAKAIAQAPKGSAERARLVDEFARQSTHTQAPTNRVVLGQWKADGGYIAEAKANGGTWYQTADGTYQAMGKEAAWETNEAFLRQQLESGKDIEYTGADIADVLAAEDKRVAEGGPVDLVPARVKEIRVLLQHADEYGYVRQGNSFVNGAN